MSTDLKEVIKMLTGNKKNSIQGQTTNEISAEIGKDIKNTRIFIREAMNTGLCELAGKVIHIGIDGRPYNVPVYRFSTKGFKKKK